MANQINWGKTYCEIEENSAWGVDTLWSTRFVPDVSAPTCWTTFALTADSTSFRADTILYTADTTQL